LATLVVVPPELTPPEEVLSPPVLPPDPDEVVPELQPCIDKAAAATTPNRKWARRGFIMESLQCNAVSWSWNIGLGGFFKKRAFTNDPIRWVEPTPYVA
jgi:hypothetical protein